MKPQLEERVEAVVIKSREKVKELLQEKEELESKIKVMYKELKEETEKKAKVSERIRKVKEEIAQEAKDTLESENKISTLIELNNCYQRDIKEMKDGIEDANKKYDEEMINISDQYEQNEMARKRSIEETEGRLEKVKEEHNELKEEYEYLSKEYQRLELVLREINAREAIRIERNMKNAKDISGILK